MKVYKVEVTNKSWGTLSRAIKYVFNYLQQEYDHHVSDRVDIRAE